jgi:2-haloacid dehalogenase
VPRNCQPDDQEKGAQRTWDLWHEHLMDATTMDIEFPIGWDRGMVAECEDADRHAVGELVGGVVEAQQATRVYAVTTMTERWATFDCYGTLIDWNRGIASVLIRLWPEADQARLLREYHAIEPLVQAGRGLPYREVGARALRAVAATEDLPLAESDSYALAESLPGWPAFPEVPVALATLRERGWRLAILSNTDPDLLTASLLQLGVAVDLQVTAFDAGSYKPAHGHWSTFFARSSTDPARHVHVAASAFHDLAPAAELGLRAVWINRLGETSDEPRLAELPDLSGLPEVLQALP